MDAQQHLHGLSRHFRHGDGVDAGLLGLNVVPGYTDFFFTWEPVCLSILTLITTVTFASILTFAVVSVDRFLSIARPLLYNTRASNRLVVCLVLMVWLTAFILAGLMIYFKVTSPIPLCVWNYPIESELYIFCGTIYTCVIISGVMYLLLSRIALRHLKTIWAQTVSGHSWEHSVQPMKETFRQKLRAFKMFVVVLGAFCVFWGPYLAVVTVHYAVRPQSIAVLDFTFLLGLLNSLGNVFIYMIFNADFRVAYKRFFRRD